MQKGMGTLIVLLVVVGLASGGIGAALAGGVPADDQNIPPVKLLEGPDVRKNDAEDEVAIVDDDDDDDDDDSNVGGDANGNDDTNGTLDSATDGGKESQPAALAKGRTAAEWMGTANLYKQRWNRMKLANYRNAREVRKLRASRTQARSTVRYYAPRVVRRGGGTSGGGTGGGDT